MGHYIVELMSLADREKDTTVNVGIANGGTEARNVMADQAKISVEMRFRDDSERTRLKEYVNKITEGQPVCSRSKNNDHDAEGNSAVYKNRGKRKVYRTGQKIAEEYGIPFEEKTAEDSLTRTIFQDAAMRSLWMEWDRMERMIIVRKSTDISDPLNHV